MTIQPEFPFMGVDFGSQEAGTTVAAWAERGVLTVRQSARGSSADRFLEDLIVEAGPEAVFIDAPLSLPGVYRGLSGCDDWFFRECDRQARAMSPMFLGGLTARAMRLAAGLADRTTFIETYPKLVWQAIAPDAPAPAGRRPARPDPRQWTLLAEFLPLPLAAGTPRHNHAFDAVLAWCGGWRHRQGRADAIGDPREGIISV